MHLELHEHNQLFELRLYIFIIIFGSSNVYAFLMNFKIIDCRLFFFFYVVYRLTVLLGVVCYVITASEL